EIVSFGGRQIDTPNGFKNVLGIFPKGWRVPLTYRQDKREHSTSVRLTGVHADEELLKLLERRQPSDQDEPPGGRRPQHPSEPRRPGNQPQPEKTPLPDGQQPRPTPRLPQRPTPHEVEIPEEIQKLIEPRPGFANYYFNRLNRDRVWSAFTAKSDFSAAA